MSLNWKVNFDLGSGEKRLQMRALQKGKLCLCLEKLAIGTQKIKFLLKECQNKQNKKPPNEQKKY